MKKIFRAFFILPFLTIATCGVAQVEIDQSIHLLGGAGQSAITGINDPPVNSTDAANKDYVDKHTYSHNIGDLFEGGIIVALWKEGNIEKGLIASLTDLSSGTEWSGNTSNLIGTTAQSFNNGSSNTSTIIVQSGGGNTSGKAATLCDDYTNSDTGTGVYSDWYLPAAWELQLCYNSAFIINTILGNTDGFQPGYYWSSTEDSATKAWNKWFSNGTSYSQAKGNLCRVRAMRRF